MNNISVLLLNGAPGSGKSTLANEISEQLRKADVAHAVIDLDEFALIYPSEVHLRNSLKWKNLASVWPNYAELGELKVIIPILIDTTEDLAAIKRAAPGKSFVVCALSAPLSILKERVTERESNEYWRARLRSLVEGYQKRDKGEFADFRVTTHDKTITETTRGIARRVGWLD
ncbi:MAG: P-loop NTPase fold protein [Candidatus Saccharimonadales bacterium]